MTGRIAVIVDHQDCGVIVGDDGAEYAFHSGALIDTPFRRLYVGDAVEFLPIRGTGARHAGLVRRL
jgi:cold shock CspA family protein